ncbi:MAG TPA: DUF6245 family protein [Ktedonobacterales bacterium]|nr:DUF6245 family protein [Ktedonobacterales bacterium]
MSPVKEQQPSDDAPASVAQLVAAMQALGRYSGENSAAEHEAEAKRLGSANAYRARLANALLGLVEVETLLADGAGLSAEQMQAAHGQALVSAGVEDDPARLLGFLRWRALRVEGPLRDLAQDEATGPLILAAAHAAEGLQQLLGVCEDGQRLATASPTQMTADLIAARQALADAIANIDIMFDLIAQVERL